MSVLFFFEDSRTLPCSFDIFTKENDLCGVLFASANDVHVVFSANLKGKNAATGENTANTLAPFT